MILKIDYRERECIKYIQENTVTIVEPLAVGDFCITRDRQIEYIFERKTIPDLAASIIDGRFREQKQRLLESVIDPSRIIYIIEGSRIHPPHPSHQAPVMKKSVDSAILNLIFKHRYTVLFTNSPQDTMETLYTITKMSLEPTVYQPKLLKKSKEPLDVFIAQLSCIPGVSYNIAQAIVANFPTYKSLVYILENDPGKMLEIQISPTRKIGKALLNALLRYLTSPAPEPE